MARGLLTALRFAALAATLVVCASCDTPTDPEDPYIGQWRGTITDAAYGAGAYEMVVQREMPAGYRGTWRMVFQSKTVSGSFEAPAQFTPLVLTCGATLPGGGAAIDLSLNRSQATGALRSSNPTPCEGMGGGPLSAARQ